MPRGFVAACFLFLAACTSSTATPEAAPSPTTTSAAPAVDVSGPAPSEGQATAAAQDLASSGYAESEYFFGGTATTYEGEHHADGVWDAHEGDTSSPFRSRMVVRRPQDSATFSGTVVLEWFNVTTGADADPSWNYAAAEIMREGHAWVGVSAQPTGVAALAKSDPARYGSLNHPGNNYSYDVFTHAARALTNHSGTAPLGDLSPTTLIATGLSASVAFLIAYLNGVQPLVETFDGFLLHAPAQPAPIRTDRAEPTLVFVTETDLTHFGWAHIRPPDSDSVRTWEVAGTAHADAWLLNQDGGGYLASCPGRVNEGPHRQTLRAALHHLVAWVRTGEAPPAAPRLALATEDPPVIARDEHGNALGGIRTPFVDVPVSALSGAPAPGQPPFCSSFGSTIPFDAATLARLYPDHAAYVDAFTASTEATVDAGFLLRPEADEMIAAAEQSAIGTGLG
jgi:hypothetical protein